MVPELDGWNGRTVVVFGPSINDLEAIERNGPSRSRIGGHNYLVAV